MTGQHDRASAYCSSCPSTTLLTNARKTTSHYSRSKPYRDALCHSSTWQQPLRIQHKATQLPRQSRALGRVTCFCNMASAPTRPGTMLHTTLDNFPAIPRGYPAKVVGCMLGKMCGDVLGAAVEGWSIQRLLTMYPEGLVDFERTARGFGCYTDDSQMAIALARSLVNVGSCDAGACAAAYAKEFEERRGYGGSAVRIMHDLAKGEDYTKTGEKYFKGGSFANGGVMRIAPVGLAYRDAPLAVLHKAVTAALLCTHVHPHAVDGAFLQAAAVAALSKQPGCSALLAAQDDARIVGVADGASSSGTAAVSDLHGVTHTARALIQDEHDAATHHALAPEHAIAGTSTASECTEAQAGCTNPEAPAAPCTDGSCTHELLQADRSDIDLSMLAAHEPRLTPSQLLEYLCDIAQTQEMKDKTRHILDFCASPEFKQLKLKHADQSWRQYFGGKAWEAEIGLVSQVSEPFQIRATDAVACALVALVFHWNCPEDAVVAAVHYGGDTDTIAAIVGALMGAFYGCSWLPARWLVNLENGISGRDEVVALSLQLAELDVQD